MADYYGELCTKVYESNKSLADGKELEFYLSFVTDKKMKVLEPMCGNGRMLVPFLQHGVDIEGFDISEEMLKACREKCEKLKLNANVYYEKIENFKSDKKYDLIMIPFGSFSLLPDRLVYPSLENMRSVLKGGGKLLLTIVPKKADINEIPDWIETNRIDFDGETIIEYKKVQYDEQNEMLHTRLKYLSIKENKINRVEIMDFPIRLYELDEFK